jgi:hypothetical protein
MSIDYHHATFSLFCVGGDQRLLENGWAFGFSTGLTCTYYTKGRSAVRWAVAQGYAVRVSALDAMQSHTDDDTWSATQERDRVAKNLADGERHRQYLIEREALVAQAKAKLTAEEFGAVLAEGAE